MKKLIVCAVCALLMISSGPALAQNAPAPSDTPAPMPSSNPTFTPAPEQAPPFSGLISLNAVRDATAEDIVRVQLRLRELHYFNFKPTGNYQGMTAGAAKAFQLKHTADDGSPMISDGTIGPQTMDMLFRHNVARSDIAASIPIGTTKPAGVPVKGEAVQWNDVKAALVPGSSYLITDYNSGVTFYMAFIGGENHAEMECTDAAGAAVLKELFGGEYNFSKRAVTVSINDKQVAASLQGYPHGVDRYPSNGMSGHVCLYFSGSLSHVGALPDVEHQALIYTASGM